MANTPETAYTPTDEELDEIVESELAEIGQSGMGGTDVTDETAHAATSPADDADELEDEDEPGTQPEGDDDEDEVVATGSRPAAKPADASSAIPTTGAKPFQFKASGAVHELPGALELPTGDVFIPKAHLETFRKELADGRDLRVNYQNYKRENDRKLNRFQKERTDRDIESDLIIKEWDAFLKMTPDERLDYAEQLDAKKPELEIAIAREKLERDRKALAEERNPTLTPEEQAEKRTVALRNELNETYRQVMEVPEIASLPKDKVAAIFKKHAGRLDRLVVKGEKPGEELFDDSDVRADLQMLYELTQANVATSAPSKPAVTAADKNARRNADVNAIPPVVRQRTPKEDTERPRNGKGQFKGNRRGFRDAFMAGDLDSD